MFFNIQLFQSYLLLFFLLKVIMQKKTLTKGRQRRKINLQQLSDIIPQQSDIHNTNATQNFQIQSDNPTENPKNHSIQYVKQGTYAAQIFPTMNQVKTDEQIQYRIQNLEKIQVIEHPLIKQSIQLKIGEQEILKVKEVIISEQKSNANQSMKPFSNINNYQSKKVNQTIPITNNLTTINQQNRIEQKRAVQLNINNDENKLIQDPPPNRLIINTQYEIKNSYPIYNQTQLQKESNKQSVPQSQTSSKIAQSNGYNSLRNKQVYDLNAINRPQAMYNQLMMDLNQPTVGDKLLQNTSETNSSWKQWCCFF